MSNPFEVYLQKVRTIIQTDGVFVQSVATQPARYHYTIGLSQRFGYELITVGLPPRVLADLAARLLKDGDVQDGTDIIEVANVPLRMQTLELTDGALNRRPLVNIALQLGYEPARLRQVLWPDEHGCFPADAGYKHPIVQDVDQFVDGAQQ